MGSLFCSPIVSSTNTLLILLERRGGRCFGRLWRCVRPQFRSPLSVCCRGQCLQVSGTLRSRIVKVKIGIGDVEQDPGLVK